MLIGLVCAGDEVALPGYKLVGDYLRPFEPDGSGGTGDEAGFLDVFFGHVYEVGGAEGVAQLGFVYVHVAANGD